MKRARSVISFSTSACLSGGTFTVVICVTTPLLARISGMALLLDQFVEDNAQGAARVSVALQRSGGGHFARTRFDRLRESEGAPGDVGMQALDHAAIKRHRAL